MTAVAPTLAPLTWPQPGRLTRPTGPSRMTRPRPARPLRVSRPARPRRPVRVERAVHLRRRVAVALVATVALLGIGNAAGAFSGGSASRHAPGSLSVVQYTVQPGDTLWSIARALEPRRDPREVVDALVAARHTDTVRAGEVIEWAGL